MKTIYTLLLLATLLFIGCGTSTSPVTPDTERTPTVAERNAYFTAHASDYPTIIVIEGKAVNLESFLKELGSKMVHRNGQAYQPMPPGWIPDGSAMTTPDLEIYFPAHIAESNTGGMQNPWFCPFYIEYQKYWVFMDSLYPQPEFDFSHYCVWLMEKNRYDVPDELDIFPNC